MKIPPLHLLLELLLLIVALMLPLRVRLPQL